MNEFGAQKRFDKVVEVAHQTLKTEEKEQLKKSLEEIIKFVSSSNIYDQTMYSQQQETIQELKSKLENYLIDNPQSGSPSKSSLWKKVIPVSFLAVSVLVAMVIIINIRKKKLIRKK